MLFFRNINNNKIIGTNYKVMSTTFHNYNNFKLISETELNINDFIYVLGRNPYERVESFYRDKFNKSLELNKSNIWHKCHKIFFPILGISNKLSKKDKINIFKSITFKEFVIMLPEHYYKNTHLYKQATNFKKYKNVHKLKIESNHDKIFMEKEFKIDTNIILNETDKNINTDWNEESIKIINKLYNQDFIYFNYKML